MRILIWVKRNLKELVRDPLTLVFTIGMPLVLLVMFKLIDLGSVTSQYQMVNFAPGIAVFSFAFIMLFTAILISTDRTSSFLTRLFSSPLKSYEFILGYALTMLPLVLVQSILFFVVAGLMDNSIFTVNMLWAILILIPISFMYILLGVLFGSLFTDKQVGGVTSTIITGSSLLNGMWFPKEFFDGNAGFDIVTRILPFRYGVDLARLFLAGDFSSCNVLEDIVIPLIVIAAYTIVIGVLSVIAFKSKMLKDTK